MLHSQITYVVTTYLFLCFFSLTLCDQSRDSYNTRLQNTLILGCSTPSKNASTSFRNNLNLLYSDFVLQSSQAGFYNTSVGAGSPDTVYGYFMCRGDINHHLCQGCVLNATDFARKTPCESVAGSFLSEYCSFGYSNRSLSGSYDPRSSLFATDHIETSVSNYNQFNKTLASTLASVINLAAFNSSQVSGFATAEGSVTRDETIYTMAQCTPDIAGVKCQECLESGYSTLRKGADGAPGAVVLMDKCMLRYDNVSFYDFGESKSNEGEGLRVSFIVLLFLGYCYLV